MIRKIIAVAFLSAAIAIPVSASAQGVPGGVFPIETYLFAPFGPLGIEQVENRYSYGQNLSAVQLDNSDAFETT